MTLAPDDPRHGTLTGYDHHRCRCPRCTNAKREYEYRLRNPDKPVPPRDITAPPHHSAAECGPQWLPGKNGGCVHFTPEHWAARDTSTAPNRPIAPTKGTQT